MLMISGPTLDNWIEHQDQSARRQRVVLLDDVPGSFQVSMHTLCWFNQQVRAAFRFCTSCVRSGPRKSNLSSYGGHFGGFLA